MAGDQRTQIRGGTGIFTGKPAYVWISNQIGNTGMLTGQIEDEQHHDAAVQPESACLLAGHGHRRAGVQPRARATDPDFKFPQAWRSNIGVDRLLPWGLVATGEFLYNRDVNGIYYLNANLPGAQSSFAGVDNRPRWTGVACAAAGQVGPCVTRINNAPGNQVTAAYVLQNQDIGRSWSLAEPGRVADGGSAVKGAYSYGVSRNTVDASAPRRAPGRRSRSRATQTIPACRIRRTRRASGLRQRVLSKRVLRPGRHHGVGVLGGADQPNSPPTPATSLPAT